MGGLSTWRTAWKNHSWLGGNVCPPLQGQSCSSHLLTPGLVGITGHRCSLRGHTGTLALPPACATAGSGTAAQGLVLPRAGILMFAEGFETQCMVQSTDCSSQEGKAMSRQVVPGQLGVLTLSWHMVPVPRAVGGQPGVGQSIPPFPWPSEMLAFICKQLHRGWEPLGRLKSARLEGKASKLRPGKS